MLGVDALFLLAGVTIFVILLDLVPVMKLRRLLFQAAMGISVLLIGTGCFHLPLSVTGRRRDCDGAFADRNSHESGEFLRMWA